MQWMLCGWWTLNLCIANQTSAITITFHNSVKQTLILQLQPLYSNLYQKQQQFNIHKIKNGKESIHLCMYVSTNVRLYVCMHVSIFVWSDHLPSNRNNKRSSSKNRMRQCCQTFLFCSLSVLIRIVIVVFVGVAVISVECPPSFCFYGDFGNSKNAAFCLYSSCSSCTDDERTNGRSMVSSCLLLNIDTYVAI